MKRHFIKRPVTANSVTSKLPARVDRFLQDFAQSYGVITYSDILAFAEYADASAKKELKNAVSELKQLMTEFSGDLYEAASEDPDVKMLCDNIVNMILSQSV